jgi:hypothetical protein
VGDLTFLTTWENKILEPLVLWVLILIVRYAATGIYYKHFGRVRTSEGSELIRGGVDVSFMALGIFWGLAWERTPFARVYFIAFIVGVCLSYFFFLFVEGKKFSEIFRLRKPYFLSLAASWYLGWLVLRGAVLLKGGN